MQISSLSESYIDSILILDIVEHIGGKLDNDLEGLIEKMRLDSQLQLCNVLAGNALLVELVESLPDHIWVNVVKFNREQHLNIPLKLLKHVRIAVF